MSQKKEAVSKHIPAKEFARITANARRTGSTDIDEAERHLGHRAQYLFQGFPTNVDRRRGAVYMSLVSSRETYMAAGVSQPHFR